MNETEVNNGLKVLVTKVNNHDRALTHFRAPHLLLSIPSSAQLRQLCSALPRLNLMGRHQGFRIIIPLQYLVHLLNYNERVGQMRSW